MNLFKLADEEMTKLAQMIVKGEKTFAVPQKAVSAYYANSCPCGGDCEGKCTGGCTGGFTIG